MLSMHLTRKAQLKCLYFVPLLCFTSYVYPILPQRMWVHEGRKEVCRAPNAFSIILQNSWKITISWYKLAVVHHWCEVIVKRMCLNICRMLRKLLSSDNYNVPRGNMGWLLPQWSACSGLLLWITRSSMWVSLENLCQILYIVLKYWSSVASNLTSSIACTRKKNFSTA